MTYSVIEVGVLKNYTVHPVILTDVSYKLMKNYSFVKNLTARFDDNNSVLMLKCELDKLTRHVLDSIQEYLREYFFVKGEHITLLV